MKWNLNLKTFYLLAISLSTMYHTTRYVRGKCCLYLSTAKCHACQKCWCTFFSLDARTNKRRNFPKNRALKTKIRSNKRNFKILFLPICGKCIRIHNRGGLTLFDTWRAVCSSGDLHSLMVHEDTAVFRSLMICVETLVPGSAFVMEVIHWS